MIGTRARTLSPDDLRSAAEALLAAGGRVRFAYAWSPAEGEVEVRYIASVPDQRDFEMWVVKGFRELPSLAAIFPSLGWYEREMMDLNGLRFLDHPEPYPLVLKDSGQEFGEALMNAVPAATGRARLPDIDAVDVQQLPFGPIRADVVEVRRVHVRLRRRTHHPLPAAACSSSIEAWSPASRARTPAGGRHGRARVRRGIGRACARLLRSGRARRRLRRPGPGECAARPARGTGAHLQSPPLPRPPVPHDHAQGRRGARKASGGEGEATERPPDREPLPAQPAHPGRPAPRPRPRAVAWRRPREPARGVRDLCREARELRESSRSPDHHRSAAAKGGVRPGRDRTCGESVRASTATCAATIPTPTTTACR